MSLISTFLPSYLLFRPHILSLPNIPLPVQIKTRVCPPILFESYGDSAAHDHHYVNGCYKRVCELMQKELNQLFAEEKQLC